MKAPFLLGRMLFGGFFLYNGINHLRQAKSMGSYAEAKGVPAGGSHPAVMPMMPPGGSMFEMLFA